MCIHVQLGHSPASLGLNVAVRCLSWDALLLTGCKED